MRWPVSWSGSEARQPLRVFSSPIPRHLKPARPDAEPVLSGSLLLTAVGALTIPWPIDGPAPAHNSGVDVAGFRPAYRNRPPITVFVARLAHHHPIAGQLDHDGFAVPPAFVGLPLSAFAGLPRLRRVDAP